MKIVKNDNVVRFIECIYTKDEIYIVCEFCNEGDF